MGIHRWLLDSLHKEPVMWRAIIFHWWQRFAMIWHSCNVTDIHSNQAAHSSLAMTRQGLTFKVVPVSYPSWFGNSDHLNSHTGCQFSNINVQNNLRFSSENHSPDNLLKKLMLSLQDVLSYASVTSHSWALYGLFLSFSRVVSNKVRTSTHGARTGPVWRCMNLASPYRTNRVLMHAL